MPCRVTVQAIDIIEDERLMAVFVGLQVDAEGGGIAIDPSGVARQHTPQALAFAQTFQGHRTGSTN